MIIAWEQFFQEEENVTILEGDLTEVSCDAIVSPANSFGFMDGGVDYAISMRLGWDLQNDLQDQKNNFDLMLQKMRKMRKFDNKEIANTQSVKLESLKQSHKS